MKANEFFKKVGIDAVRSYVAAYEDALTGDLKRLVKSHELVRLHGGLDAAKKHVDRTVFKLSYQIIELKQAIADVESCMEVSSDSN